MRHHYTCVHSKQPQMSGVHSPQEQSCMGVAPWLTISGGGGGRRIRASMEGRPKRGGSAHPITLIQEPICNRWRSNEFTHRHRPSRPKCLFIPDKIKPIGSEPTSPEVNCAGQVKGRIAPEEKLPEWPIRAEKKRSMFKYLACSFRCVQGQGLPPGDSDEEEGDDRDDENGGYDSGKAVARWFTEAEEGVKKSGFVETASEIEGREKGECLAAKLPPGNALQLMRGKPAHPTRVGDSEDSINY